MSSLTLQQHVNAADDWFIQATIVIFSTLRMILPASSVSVSFYTVIFTEVRFYGVLDNFRKDCRCLLSIPVSGNHESGVLEITIPV